MANRAKALSSGCVRRPCNQGAGFSLLELMIAMLLITLLLAMSVPSYQQYVLRSNRASAIETLLSIAGCQQQVYAVVLRYDTRQCLPGSNNDHYSFRMDPPDTASTTVFAVIASPAGAQLQDPCGELMLDQSGWRSSSGPEEIQRKCWEGR